jgi:ATP-binding cassette subfamily B (MDR/TAP) protein 10
MAVPFCLGRVIDIIYTADPNKMRENLTMLSTMLLGVFLVGGLCNFGRVYLMSVSGIGQAVLVCMVYIKQVCLQLAMHGIRKNMNMICNSDSDVFSGQRITQTLRQVVFNSIMQQEIAFFDKNKTGELVNRLSADTSLVSQSVTMNISDGLRSTFMVVAGVSMMVSRACVCILIPMSELCRKMHL